MPNILTIPVANPDQLLNAGAYGAGAVIQVQSAALEAGPFTDDGTVPIVTAVTSYTYYDTDGTSPTWYRTRYENAAGTTISDWSLAFQPDQPTALVAYAVPGSVKRRMSSSDSYSADDEAVLETLCKGINGWIELIVGRALGPIASATYTFDRSNWSQSGSVLWLRNGVRSITSLKVSGGTGQTLQTVPASEYVILPRSQDRSPGWPGTRIYLHNGGGTNPFSEVSAGLGTSEIVMAMGFPAIPDEITELAETAVVRAWHGRQAGQADIIGSDEDGAPIVSRYVSSRDRETLNHYRWRRGVY